MTIEWVFAAALVSAFVFLTVAFNRPDGRSSLRASRAIRWDRPAGR